MSKKRVALIGIGSIGTTIADELVESLSEYYELSGIMKNRESQIEELIQKYNVPVVTDFKKLLDTDPDFIIEAASGDMVRAYGKDILKKGIDFIPLSVGGLADPTFYKVLQDTAKENNAVLYIPSGAIGGTDLMRKMTLAADTEVKINTYKAPDSLKGAPYLEDKQLSDSKVEVIFEGSAEEAIKGFPKNINVAVMTALATVGPSETHTVIHSDPKLKANIHEISLRNDQGTADIRVAGMPSDNPKTSSITPWSVIALLKNIAEPVRFF